LRASPGLCRDEAAVQVHDHLWTVAVPRPVIAVKQDRLGVHPRGVTVSESEILTAQMARGPLLLPVGRIDGDLIVAKGGGAVQR